MGQGLLPRLCRESPLMPSERPKAMGKGVQGRVYPCTPCLAASVGVELVFLSFLCARSAVWIIVNKMFAPIEYM